MNNMELFVSCVNLITHNVSAKTATAVATVVEKVKCSKYFWPWSASLFCALNSEHANNNYLYLFEMFVYFLFRLVVKSTSTLNYQLKTEWKKSRRNTHRSGLNVLMWNGRYMVLFGNISGLTMLRIKINIKLNRTGIKISSTVCTGWRYWMRKFFHINRRNLSKFVAILRPSSPYGGGAAFVPISMLLWWLFCGGTGDEGDGGIASCRFDVLFLLLSSEFNGCVHSLILSVDVDAVQYDDDDADDDFGLWCDRYCSCSSSPLSSSPQFTCS